MAILSFAVLKPVLVFSPMFLPCATVCARRRWDVAYWISVVFGTFALECRSNPGCVWVGVLGKSLAAGEDDSMAPDQWQKDSKTKKKERKKGGRKKKEKITPSLPCSPMVVVYFLLFPPHDAEKLRSSSVGNQKTLLLHPNTEKKIKRKRDAGAAQAGIAVRACDTT